ncbi:MAG: hypothetical protein ACFFG0_00300 [Candidatus Thorarchaeota archaeon]
MPFKTYNNWLFDGQKNSPIPKPKNGINILKYNSPITHTFVVSMFLRHGPLNNYLNKYFNDINLRYLTKEELFKFIKKCVRDFKVTRRDITYYPRRPKQILFDKLREKTPGLKNDDISLLCDIIEKSDNRDSIYESLGLEKPKKKKVKKERKKKGKKITLKEFLDEHFSIIEL